MVAAIAPGCQPVLRTLSLPGSRGELREKGNGFVISPRRCCCITTSLKRWQVLAGKLSHSLVPGAWERDQHFDLESHSLLPYSAFSNTISCAPSQTMVRPISRSCSCP